MNRLILLVESRIRGDVYVRFGGELPKTHRSNTAGRWMLSLLLISEPKPIMEDWMNAGHVYYILNETEKSIEYYRKAQELCDSHDEFVRLYQIDKKDLIKQGANEVDLFILPDELI